MLSMEEGNQGAARDGLGPVTHDFSNIDDVTSVR